MSIRVTQGDYSPILFFNRYIDRNIFNSSYRKPTLATKPILLCVSDIELNLGLEDFCSIPTTGTKILVGTGSQFLDFQSRFPDVIFAGHKDGVSLAHYYANADVLVHPHNSNIISWSLFEAIACGTPIACYPTEINMKYIYAGMNGEFDTTLTDAVNKCLNLNRFLVEKTSYILESIIRTSVFNANLASVG